MEPVVITAIIGAIGAVIISVLTHIKFSSCYGFKLQTTTHFEEKNTLLQK